MFGIVVGLSFAIVGFCRQKQALTLWGEKEVREGLRLISSNFRPPNFGIQDMSCGQNTFVFDEESVWQVRIRTSGVQGSKFRENYLRIMFCLFVIFVLLFIGGRKIEKKNYGQKLRMSRALSSRAVRSELVWGGSLNMVKLMF